MYNSEKFFRHWNNVQDVTLRLIKQIPQDKLDFKPSENSLSLKEVAIQVFHAERVFADTGWEGGITLDDFNENPPPELHTVNEIYEYGKKVHDHTNRIYMEKSWEELNKPVKTPWGEMPLFHHLHSAFEHHWHTRGKLYVYLEMVGVEDPVFVYDYPGERAPV